MGNRSKRKPKTNCKGLIVLINIFILCTLLIIIYQDLKDREVYGITFPILIALLGVLHYQYTSLMNFLYAMMMNVGILIVIMAILYVYNMVRLKKAFFKEVFGWGDLFFFMALAVGFPTITFVVLFVFSLLFSLIAWLVLKKKSNHNTVPLAGLMAVFLGVVLIVNLMTKTLILYLV